MKKLEKYSFLLTTLLYMLIALLVLTILNLCFPITNHINSILCLLCMSFYSLFLGINKGKNATAKGYVVGCKTGALVILLLFILNSFFVSFSLCTKELLYYLILFTCVVFGSVIGINKKKKL